MSRTARLTDQERHATEAAARVIVQAEEMGLHDSPDALGVTPLGFCLLARAYIELRGQVRSLHDLVDQADPNDPIAAALTKVGLEHRPRESTRAEPRIVRSAEQVAALGGDDLVALYCRVMRVSPVFFKRETYVVRVWDGMDGCWTDCTRAVPRDEALRYWSEQTGGGTHHVAYAEIDYYEIFPSGTHMKWDGSEGREMNR